MARVSKEQIEQAKQLDLLTYIRLYEPHELVRKGSDYCTREHDSLVISENGLWHWFSHNIGGITALQYLIKVKNMEFVDAVMHLCGDTPVCMEIENHKQAQKEKTSFILPTACKNNDKVITYLRHRGISNPIIDYCIDNKLIYESVEYHNAVFIGYDKDKTPRYAALRGTWQHMANPFKGEVSGSDKRFSFNITPNEKSKKLIVSESAVDVLSVATIRNDIGMVHYLSIGGVYAPKKNTSAAKLPKALAQYLIDHDEINTIELCLDNDSIGSGASFFLTNKLMGMGYEMFDNPPKLGKDYNEYLQILNNEKTNTIVR